MSCNVAIEIQSLRRDGTVICRCGDCFVMRGTANSENETTFVKRTVAVYPISTELSGHHVLS